MIVRLDVGTCTVCGGTWEGGYGCEENFHICVVLVLGDLLYCMSGMMRE